VEDDIANTKAKGKELFAKGEYLSAIYLYNLVNSRDNVMCLTFFLPHKLLHDRWLVPGHHAWNI